MPARHALLTLSAAAALTAAACVCLAVETPASPAVPATLPSTRPADGRIAELILQLSDDAFAARERAADELQKIGPDAAPALREAAKNGDAGTQTYAQAILKRIADGDSKSRIPRGFLEGRQARTTSVSVQSVNGARTIQATEDNRSVRIVEDANGIKMTLSETKDGKTESAEYTAADAATLKRESPAAHEVYERYANSGQNHVFAIGQAGGMIVGGAGQQAAIKQMEAQQARMRAKMEQDLENANLPEDQKARVLEQLRRRAPETQPTTQP